MIDSPSHRVYAFGMMPNIIETVTGEAVTYRLNGVKVLRLTRAQLAWALERIDAIRSGELFALPEAEDAPIPLTDREVNAMRGEMS